jgi:hypothetical protein
VQVGDKFTHDQLAYIGYKLEKMYGSCKHINPNYLNSFHSLEQLLLSTVNLLSIKEYENSIYFIVTRMRKYGLIKYAFTASSDGSH